jgi:hypothetical protein
MRWLTRWQPAVFGWQPAVFGVLFGCVAACGNAERPAAPSAAALVEQARAALAQSKSVHVDALTAFSLTPDGQKPKAELNAGFKGWVTQTGFAGKTHLNGDEVPTVLAGGHLFTFVTPAVARALPDQKDSVNTWGDVTGELNLRLMAGYGASTLTELRRFMEPSNTPQSAGEERLDGQDALRARFSVTDKGQTAGVTISVEAKAPHKPLKIEITSQGQTVAIYRLSSFDEGPPIAAPTGTATPGTQ